MKKKLFFLPFVAALALTGCSNEDEPANNGGQEGDNGADAGYIAINIVSPTATGSRAGGDGNVSDETEFEAGDETAGENTITQAMFLFFDADGNSIQTPQIVNLTKDDGTTLPNVNPAVEWISQVTVVVAGNEGAEPAQLLVILNPSENAYKNANGQSLNTITASFGNYGISEAGKFYMTNSVYVEPASGETPRHPVCATDIKGHTHASEADAKADAVDVYVERVVAKVLTAPRASENGGFEIKSSDIEYADGSKVTVKPVIKGIEIANVPQNSFLFKQLTIDTNTWTKWDTEWAEGWNDPSNKRCYWAACDPGMMLLNKSWSALKDGPDPNTMQKFYTLENTLNADSYEPAVLITAQLVTEETDGDGNTTGKPLSFVKWASGFYTLDGMKSQYASLLKNRFRVRFSQSEAIGYRDIDDKDLYWLKTSNDGGNEHSNLVKAGTFKAYETTCHVLTVTDLKNDGRGSTGYQYMNETGDWKDLDNNVAVNEFLERQANRCWVWKDGMCYYYTKIPHFGPKVDGGSNFSVGMVRNHIYQLTLTELANLGTPVFDPDREIIPEKPVDELSYLAAKVNILKWKLVKNNVKFE